MKRWLRCSTIAFLCSGAAAASAADFDSDTSNPAFYLSASGGFTPAINPEFDAVGSSGEIDLENGWTGSAAIGLHIAENVRGEIELAIHQNELDRIEIDGLGTIEVSGDATAFSALAKVAYDFDVGALRPYIGVGIGIARYGIDFDSPFTGSDHATVLAGAVQGGWSVPVTDRVDLFTKAELLILSNVTLDPTASGGAELNHPMFLSGSAGLRIHL